MASYPKWLYHATKAPVLAKDEAEHKAMDAGWFESPADALDSYEASLGKSEEKFSDLVKSLGDKDIRHPAPKKGK